jgi:hypothetical protein
MEIHSEILRCDLQGRRLNTGQAMSGFEGNPPARTGKNIEKGKEWKKIC